MNDEPLLKDRIYKKILERLPDEGQAAALRDEITILYNEHSRDSAMLNWREKDRIKRLEKLKSWLESRIETRDPKREEEKKQALGDRYRDYLAAEISALEWIIKFTKEHSI